MSDVYLSWRTATGLVDAGRLDAWPTPLGKSPALADLAAGKDVPAAAAEHDAAAQLMQALHRYGTGIPAETWGPLTQLLNAVISRAPGMETLVAEPASTDEFNPPELVEWVAADKDRWASWPPERMRRINLLLRLQPLLLDVTPDDDDFAEKATELLACLQLLKDFPAAKE